MTTGGSAIVLIKLLPVAIVEVSAAATIPDANLALNGLMLLVLLFGAPRFFKSKQAEALLEEKDRTISTHEQALRAADRKAEDLAAKADELAIAAVQREEKIARYQEIAAGFQARYEEQSKYTAKEALEAMNAEAARRHIEIMGVLVALQEVLGERRESNKPDLPPIV